jgi:PAS domain S-box-containing protein
LTAVAARRIIERAVNAEPAFGLQAALAELGTDLSAALERVPIPAYVVSAGGIIMWANDKIEAVIGPARGRPVLDVVAPESRRLAEEKIAAKRLSNKPTHFEISLLDRNGRRVPVEVNSVPLRNSRCTFVGIFGIVTAPGELAPKPPPAREPRLTPRQHDVLRLLGRGASTAQIAETLGISRETARNHVRGLLMRLGQSSRVAAVAYAHQHGLL